MSKPVSGESRARRADGLRVLLAALAGAACLSAASSATIYTLSSADFTNAAGVYSTSMSVSGWFETAAPIPPGATTAPGDIVDYFLSDGIQTFTPANSQPSNCCYWIQAGAGGLPENWQLEIYRTPVPGTLGAPVAFIASSFIGGNFVSVGSLDAQCTNISAGECNTADFPTAPNAGYLQLLNTPTAPATWQVSGAVPALPAWGGGLLALLLLAGAAAMLRSRSRSAGVH